MSARRILASCLIAGCAVGLQVLPALAAPPDPAMVLERADTDNDGSLSLAEVEKASQGHFDRLDRDHDGKISKAEAQVDHVGEEAFATADGDHDGTVDRAEWAKVMEKVFKLADTDSDGKVTVDELKADNGKTLLGMMQ